MDEVRRLVVATRNRHKTAEIAAMLGAGWQVEDLTRRTGLPEPAEVGKTFDENAMIKALAASAALPDAMVLADDSGLEVDALGGAPGIYSARYAGEDASDEENRQHLLNELAKRSTKEGKLAARFYCAMALAERGELVRTFEGRLEGRVVLTPAGENGFGYDPLFVPEGYERTLAELSAEEKNRISHRSRVLGQVMRFLEGR